MAGGDGVELFVGKLMARNLVANQLLGVGKGEVVAVRLARLDERGEATDDGFDLGEQFAVVGEIALEASSFIDGHDAPLQATTPRNSRIGSLLVNLQVRIGECSRMWTAAYL